MEEDDFMTDYGNKLEADQKRSGQDAVQVQHHADFPRVLQVVITLSWCGTGASRVGGVAKDAVEGEVLEIIS